MVEIELTGVTEFLRSDTVKDIAEQAASKVRSAAGAGYEQDTYMAGSRWISSVYAEKGTDAYQDNLDKNTLLKASGGVKL